MRFLCRLGWHDWRAWTDDGAYNVTLTPLGGGTRQAYEVRQHRVCVGCTIRQDRAYMVDA